MYLQTNKGMEVVEKSIRFQGTGPSGALCGPGCHTDPWPSQGAWLSASRFMPFC